MEQLTSCSVSCSQGVRTRERTCTNPSPVNGTECIGNYTDRIVCKEGPCPGIRKFFAICKSYFSNSSPFFVFLKSIIYLTAWNRNNGIKIAHLKKICSRLRVKTKQHRFYFLFGRAIDWRYCIKMLF